MSAPVEQQRLAQVFSDGEGWKKWGPYLAERQWATVRMENRPASKTGLVPAVVFESERSYLTPLPPELPAPYCSLERGTDAYGYISVEGNYYWVPGTKREDVKVLRYAERLKIYQHRACVAEYPLPADGVKNAHFHPEGGPPPRHLPKHRKHGWQHEEQRLRALGPEVAAYVDYALATPGLQRPRFLRELLALSRKVTLTVFVQALERALRYRVVRMETLERIAWLCTSQGQLSLPSAEVDESFRERPAYQDGYLTDEPDFSLYDELPREEELPQNEEPPRQEAPSREDELPREPNNNSNNPSESENSHE